MEATDEKILKEVVKRNGFKDITPRRIESGQVNRVYDLGDYVVKFEGGESWMQGLLKPQVSMTELLIKAGAKVPKIIDSGEIKGKFYILMEKILGNNLVYGWLEFNDRQKESLIAQVAEQLKIFHSLQFENYAITVSRDRYFHNLKQAMADVVAFKDIDKSKLKKEYQADIEFLKEFYDRNLYLLDEEDTAVFVHNDIHLENIFHKGDQLTGVIDLDWFCQAPRDYELWKIADVFYAPKKTVERKLEPLYEGYKIEEGFTYLKKYYPEMFKIPNLLNRVRLYSVENILYHILDYQAGRWSENVMIEVAQKIDDFYRGDWLERMLV